MDTKLKALVSKERPNEIINSVLDLGDYYVVNLTRPGLKNTEFVLDSLYKVDKAYTCIKEFSLADDREKYLRALKNPVYLLGRGE